MVKIDRRRIFFLDKRFIVLFYIDKTNLKIIMILKLLFLLRIIAKKRRLSPPPPPRLTLNY